MSTWLPQSIRRRTLLLVLSLLTSISLMIGIIGFIEASHEIEELFDARLAQQARILQSLSLGLERMELEDEKRLALQNTFEQALVVEASGGHKYESKIAYQVWEDNTLIFRSQSAPQEPLSDRMGYASQTLGDYDWRTFSLSSIYSHSVPELRSNTIRIIVAEREDVRGEMVDKIVTQTLLPDLIGLPILSLLLWWAVGWGLKPLQQLANLISKRAPTHLEAINLEPLPTELAPVQKALNRLLFEIETMIAREQRLIADAAHELRTPLAVLKIHAQNAQQTLDQNDREVALEQLTLGVDRSTRIVSQLLTLARLDPQGQDNTLQDINLAQESRSLLAQLMPLAWEKEMEVSLDIDEALDWRTQMETGCLEIILQNLISNAVKFAPAGTEIEVKWSQNEHEFVLQVRDHGCGVSDKDKQRLTERFFREGKASGAGLGLAIVKRILERHEGSITPRDTPNGGLTIQLSFPKIYTPESSSPKAPEDDQTKVRS
ncbi:ATP-binding protein [Oceanospirillum beijerinckii]|uniref:ATP-binding protein n=1 Tax=Oceanospirillum beijerinckii TaxID=64976 RepID=UPI000569F0AD|nr:ATP-binding protein [Oceanospirillum beijerinckii]